MLLFFSLLHLSFIFVLHTHTLSFFFFVSPLAEDVVLVSKSIHIGRMHDVEPAAATISSPEINPKSQWKVQHKVGKKEPPLFALLNNFLGFQHFLLKSHGDIKMKIPEYQFST